MQSQTEIVGQLQIVAYVIVVIVRIVVSVLDPYSEAVGAYAGQPFIYVNGAVAWESIVCPAQVVSDFFSNGAAVAYVVIELDAGTAEIVRVNVGAPRPKVNAAFMGKIQARLNGALAVG